MKKSEVGGVSQTRKSFRSFVRACERSCVCPLDDVVSVAGRFFGKSPPGRGAARRGVPLLPRSRGFFAFGLGLCEDVQLSLTSVSVFRSR